MPESTESKWWHRYDIVGMTTAIDHKHPSLKIGILTDNWKLHPHCDLGGKWYTLEEAERIHAELGAAISLLKLEEARKERKD